MKIIIDRNARLIDGEFYFDEEIVIKNCENIIIGQYVTNNDNYILYKIKGEETIFNEHEIRFNPFKDHAEIQENDD